MNNMLKNMSSMMNGNQIPENIQNILQGMNNQTINNKSQNTQNGSKNQQSSNKNGNETSNPFGNIDMETILKLQNIINSMNSGQNDSRTNLLLSLKPYLKENRRNKVDQYIQLMKMEKIIEIMNPLGGEPKNV